MDSEQNCVCQSKKKFPTSSLPPPPVPPSQYNSEIGDSPIFLQRRISNFAYLAPFLLLSPVKEEEKARTQAKFASFFKKKIKSFLHFALYSTVFFLSFWETKAFLSGELKNPLRPPLPCSSDFRGNARRFSFLSTFSLFLSNFCSLFQPIYGPGVRITRPDH